MSNHRWNIRQSQIEEYSTKYLTSTSQVLKLSKHKGSLRNNNHFKEPQETGQLNIMQHPDMEKG